MLVGADVGRLRLLATTFGNQAETLRYAIALLDEMVASVAWTGGDAEEFGGAWGAILRPYMAEAVEGLTSTQEKANANADQQEEASALDSSDHGSGVAPSVGGGSSGSGVGGGRMAASFPMAPTTLDLDDESDYLGPEMQELRDSIPTNASPAQVRRWWGSLSAREQEALLKAWPVDLYKLDGIPGSVKKDLEGTGPYNRMDMVDYAIDNWAGDKPANEPKRHEGYIDIFDVNCANFVSHAMEAGGMEHGQEWGYDGDGPWYEPGRSFLGQDGWARDTNVTPGWSNADAQHDMWEQWGHKPIPPSGARPGDVLYFDFRKDGEFDHAVVVRAVGPDGTIYYAGHTSAKRTGVVFPKDSDTFEIFRPESGPAEPHPSPLPAPTRPER